MRSACGISLVLFCLVGCSLLVGCYPAPIRQKLPLLFAEDGLEYISPSAELSTRMWVAEDPRELVEGALDVLETDGGYSRLVAARALLGFFETEKGRRYLSLRACRVLAEEVIELAEPLGLILSDRDIRGGQAIPALLFRIRPRCVLRFDEQTFVIVDQLPKAWKAENGKIELDGRLVTHHPGVYDGGVPEMPIDGLNLEDELTPQRFYGRHTLNSSLVLIAPNGMRIPKKSTETVTIVRQEDLLRHGRPWRSQGTARPPATRNSEGGR